MLLDWFSETRLSKNVSLKWNTAWRPKLARSNSSSLWSLAAVFLNVEMQPNSWDIESFILSDPTVFFNNFFVSNFSWIAADLCGGHGRCLLAQQCVNHIKPWGLCHFCPKWSENNLCYNADSLDCLDTPTWKPWRHSHERNLLDFSILYNWNSLPFHTPKA